MSDSDGASDFGGVGDTTSGSDMGYSPQDIGQEVSAESDYHDAYDKHVVQKDEFSSGPYGDDLNINSRYDYDSLVVETMVHENTFAFEDSGGHHHYYKEDINLYGFVAPERDHNHTWFRPDNGVEYYHKQYDSYVDGADGSNNRDGIVEGGYHGLQEHKEIQAEQSSEKAVEEQTVEQDVPERSARLQRALDLANSRENERDEGVER